MMRVLLVLGFVVLLAPRPTAAQRTLSPGVQPFVTVNEPVVALVGVRVIDGTGGPGQDGQTVLIRDNRIEAVGPSRSVSVPAGARVLELPGHTVMPGYVMLHEHIFYPAGQGAYNQMEFSFPKLYLAGGVTTIRTGGSRDPYGDLNLKDDVDAGQAPGPRMHLTGPYISQAGFPARFLNRITTPEEARRLVRYWADEGMTSFKAYQFLTRAQLAAAIEEAHARGLQMTGHICSITFREAADLGIDNIEHSFLTATDFVKGKRPDECPDGAARERGMLELDVNGPEARGLIKHLVDKGVALTVTTVINDMRVPGRAAPTAGALDAMAPQIRDAVLRQWASIQQQKGSRAGEVLAKGMALDKAFVEAGGLLVAGIDPTGYGAVVPGWANQRQIELLHEGGFSAEQAIRIGTLNGATQLGVEREVGSIAPGKLADLTVVEGNPSADITAVRNVRWVFKDGIGYDPAKLIAAAKGVVGLY
jgi:imidazolonepropionase-like amidohydrolase